MEHFRLIHERLVFLDAKENRGAPSVNRQDDRPLRSLYLLEEGCSVCSKLREWTDIFGRSDFRHFNLCGELTGLVRNIVRQPVQYASALFCRLTALRLSGPARDAKV